MLKLCIKFKKAISQFEMVSFSSLTTVLDNNLPTFRLDALVILKANISVNKAHGVCAPRALVVKINYVSCSVSKSDCKGCLVRLAPNIVY